MSAGRPGGGNGCLYGLLGLGALMVLAGLALSSLPELGRFLAERSTTTRIEPAAEQTTDEWLPPVAEPEPIPGLAEELRHLEDQMDRAQEEDVPIAPRQQQGNVATLLWHAQTRESPPVGCVLAVDAYERAGGAFGASRVELLCPDGRAFSGDAPIGTSLTAMRTERGVVFRARAGERVGEGRGGVRALLSFDTQLHEISLHESGAAPRLFFVEELSVAHPELPPLGPPTPVRGRIVRLAVPTEVSGDLPASVATVRGTGPRPRRGDPVCELTVDPTFASSFTCRVVVRCNGEIIYGAGTAGLNDCGLERGLPTTADDDGTTPENGDPRIRFNINTNTLVVSDSTDRGTWSATFDLRPDPRCGHGAYVGAARQHPSDTPFSIGPFADAPSYQLEDTIVPLAAVNASCGSGELEVLDVGRQRSWLSFGPGGSSVAGYVGSPPRAAWGFRQ